MKVIRLLIALSILSNSCSASLTDEELAVRREKRQKTAIKKQEADKEAKKAMTETCFDEETSSSSQNSRKRLSTSPEYNDSSPEYSDSNDYHSEESFDEVDISPEHDDLMTGWHACRDETDVTMFWASLTRKEKSIIALYNKDAQRRLKVERICSNNQPLLTWWDKSELKDFWWSVLTKEEQEIITAYDQYAEEGYAEVPYTDKDYKQAHALLAWWNGLSEKRKAKNWGKLFLWELYLITDDAAYYEALAASPDYSPVTSPSLSPEPEPYK